jgi:hypothetical protein
MGDACATGVPCGGPGGKPRARRTFGTAPGDATFAAHQHARGLRDESLAPTGREWFVHNRRFMRLRPAALVPLLLACAHPQSVLDDGLTLDEHRAQAQAHFAAAQRETGAYEPGRETLDAADREMRQAAAHLLAARALESFENWRCANTPRPERTACPLLASAVTRVTELDDGISLTLRADVDAVQTFRRLDCHLAFAEAEGFARPSCPLFVKGMALALDMGEDHRIVLSGTEPTVVVELKAQARRIFAPPVPVTAK